MLPMMLSLNVSTITHTHTIVAPAALQAHVKLQPCTPTSPKLYSFKQVLLITLYET